MCLHAIFSQVPLYMLLEKYNGKNEEMVTRFVFLFFIKSIGSNYDS